jgi:hypothetical protein
MSSGGMAQLVAIGVQDVWLTGKPEISFFQSVYKKHTNFSQVVSRQVVQGKPSPGGMSTVRFERNGDMLGYVYIAPVCINDGIPSSYQTYDWRDIVSHVELYIGGQLIDTQTSEFSEFLAPDLFSQNMAKSTLSQLHGGAGTASLFYPLRFWFCENFQSALPLVALQYHEVEIRIYWSKDMNSDVAEYLDAEGNVVLRDPTAPSSIIIWDVYAQNIFLDTQERQGLTKKTHNILITQVQSMNPTNTPVMDIVFNHPVKFICATAGVIQTVTLSNVNALTSFQNQIVIQINGSDIGDYRYASPHFTQVPSYYHAPYSSENSFSFFLIPFCLETSKFQPNGSLNFSRIDSFRIVSKSKPITSVVYGVNYNILRIQNGMGGLMYSN